MKLSSLSSKFVRRLGALALSACLLAPPALATWSIVVVDGYMLSPLQPVRHKVKVNLW
jgi:hypothetical protein